MKAIERYSAEITTQVKSIQQLIPIILILLLATGLYFYKLGDYGLRTDELYSVYDAKELKLLHARPLYFILLRVWMLFGTNEAWLRGLAVLFGLGSVFLTYQLGRRLVSDSVGLIAALLLTLSPLIVSATQEVRMYPLGNLLNLCGTLALVHALENLSASSTGWWAGARVLGILATPLNFTLLLPDIVLVLLRCRDRRPLLLVFGKWLIVIILLWLPFALQLFGFKEAYESTRDVYDANTSGFAVTPPSFMQVFRQIKFLTVWPYRVPSNTILENFYRVFTALLACLLGIALFRKHRSPKLLWVAAWAFLPLGVFIFISTVSTYVLQPRYLIFISPYIFILLAAGLIRICNSQRLVAIVVTIIYLVAVNGGLAQYYASPGGADWRGMGEWITLNEKSGDIMAVTIPHGRICPFVTHYYSGSMPIYGLEPFKTKTEKQKMERLIQQLPPIQSRLWILYRKASGKGDELFQTIINEQFNVQSYKFFRGGIKLYIVTPRFTSTQKASTLPQQCSSIQSWRLSLAKEGHLS